ncbi:hypothetical protein [Gluconobacter kondonii]|uniref:hypothetical protein n=1 Tax=Gluconobacter kondonii TaxID=941463 RepID=UPI001B8D91B8|nr:hypothetical protein [Gluconobacter kondonii]MBS1057771.1 hypothetical protein [Gluconobacter kondonii]
MTIIPKIRTSHQWLDLLASRSTVIASLDLKASLPNIIYEVEGTNKSVNADALNFANCSIHTERLLGAFRSLEATGCPPIVLEKLVKDLVGRNTYGTVCELGAYAILNEAGLNFSPQVAMTGAEILNPNGAELDGCFRFPDEVYFDIKAFGFHDRLLETLRDRLSSEFQDNFIQISGGIHFSTTMVNDLLSHGFSSLVSDIRKYKYTTRESLKFLLKAKKRIQITPIELNFKKLAENNSNYPFSYAKQFTRSAPFLLIFILHPWFSGSILTSNFAGGTDRFMRAFGQATFNNVSTMIAPNTTFQVCQAAPLLSGMLFFNFWSGVTDSPQSGHYLLLNPHAKFPLPSTVITALEQSFSASLTTICV